MVFQEFIGCLWGVPWFIEHSKGVQGVRKFFIGCYSEFWVFQTEISWVLVSSKES